MKILVACEVSGVLRRAIKKQNPHHVVYSCDLLPPDDDCTGAHYQGDVKDYIHRHCWDIIIAFPPCTHLSSSGARWFKEKRADGRQQQGIDFFNFFTKLGFTRIAIENPVGIMSTHYRKPDQIIQPWQYGHGEQKATCLWLKGLPLLKPTNIVQGRESRIHSMSPSPERGKKRSETYHGIAKAMAEQWT